MSERDKQEDRTSAAGDGGVRRFQGMIAAIGGVLVGCICFLIPPDRMTDPVVKLISSLVWPYTLLLAIVLFRRQVETLLIELGTRVKGGSTVDLGIFKLGSLPEQAQRIPVPNN